MVQGFEGCPTMGSTAALALSRVGSASPPWSQAGGQRMGPELYSDLPESCGSSNKDSMVRLTPPFHEGTHEGSNQRWVASRSDPRIKQGLGGCTRVLTQQTAMTLVEQGPRSHERPYEWSPPTTLLKSHENSHQQKIRSIKQ
jgi:hypothetical protein